MRKCALVTLVMAFLVLMASSHGLAQIDGAASTSKEGSLLIWPLVQTNDGNETYIMINNNSPNDVHVKCFWEIKDVPNNPASQGLLAQFVIHMPGNVPIVFRASDGSGLDGRAAAEGMGYGEKGALRCWAVDPSDRRQISWNHLSGFATIVNLDATVPNVTKRPTSGWQYSAWRFAANIEISDGTFADGFWVGKVMGVSADDNNTMALKASPTTVVDPGYCTGPDYAESYCSLPNAAYDACAKYLTFDFLAEPSGPTKTDGYAFNSLALVPCKANLTDLATNLSTKVLYTIWNENEVKYVGLYQCANSAHESYLGSLAVPRNQKYFQMKLLHTSSGRMRVEGVSSTTCGSGSVNTPLLGVLSSRLVGSSDIVGTNASTAGKETSDWGYIWWSPTGAYYQKPRP
jgi:hypothetical protein